MSSSYVAQTIDGNVQNVNDVGNASSFNDVMNELQMVSRDVTVNEVVIQDITDLEEIHNMNGLKVVDLEINQNEVEVQDLTDFHEVDKTNALEIVDLDMNKNDINQNELEIHELNDSQGHVSLSEASQRVDCSERTLRVQKRCRVQGCPNNNTTHSMYAFPRILKLMNGMHVIEDDWFRR
jgi:hypothetical protein